MLIFKCIKSPYIITKFTSSKLMRFIINIHNIDRKLIILLI